MRYMLLMSGTRANLEAWPIRQTPADLAAHLAYVHEVTRELEASGELILFEELSGPAQARLVRGVANSDSAAPPFVEHFAQSKEFVGSFWVVDCESAERALAIAARLSRAPGPDGVPVNIPVEVRPVLPRAGA